MDHLPLDGREAPIVVSYLLPDDFSYDGGDFNGYPERNGWDFDMWRNNDRTRKHINIETWLGKINRRSEELAPFLQAWLFFGLIACCLNTQINVNDFTRVSEDGQRKFITTAKLEVYFADFFSRFPPPENDDERERVFAEREEKTAEFRATMSAASQIFEVLRGTIERGNPPNVGGLEEVHFVATLIGALSTVVAWAYTGRENRHLLGIGFGRSPLILNRFRNSGWCLNAINRVTAKFSFDMQAYVYALGTVRTSQNHKKCTIGYCFANQAGENFEPKHLVHPSLSCKSGDCEFIAAPIAEVVKVLQEGFIPVLEVQLTAETNNSPSFRVKKASKSIPYIAISHVWADGLGNSRANAIPTCQLNALLRSFQNIQDNHDKKMGRGWDGSMMAFWLDTLCIPVEDRFKHLRDFSIQKMHEIYTESHCVLVLDHDFSKMAREAKLCEVLSRLVLSGWITRLWTFQEGSLPPLLYLRVRNGVIDVDKLLVSYIHRNYKDWVVSRPIMDTLTKNCMSLYLAVMPRRSGTTYKSKEYKQDDGDQFIQDTVWSMSWRMTSRPGDETICIATSLGFDPSAILRIKPPEPREDLSDENSQKDLERFQEERMVELLKLLPSIPLTILFANGPGLTKKGFRWAPKTLLQPKTTIGPGIPTVRPELLNEEYESPKAYLHPGDKGLVAFIPGIRIPKLDVSKTRWEIICPDGVMFRAGNFFDDSLFTKTTILRNVAIIMPTLPGQLACEFGTEDRAFLVAINGKSLNPRAPRFSLKMLTVALIIGPVFIERNAAAALKGQRSNAYKVSGELIKPRWWLLDQEYLED